MHIYGSLVIYSPTGQTEPYSLNLPQHVKKQGEHRFLRFSRGWMTQLPIVAEDDFTSDTLIIPTRNRHLTIDMLSLDEIYSSRLVHLLKDQLLSIDNEYNVEDASILNKLHMAMDGVEEACQGPFSYSAILNNASPRRSFFALLASSCHIHLLGVVGDDASVQLVWSSDPDLEGKLRAKYGTTIHTYRFPTVYDRPLFIGTQFVCSYWYRWTKDYDNTPMAYLHAFNALQARLFKNSRLTSSSEAINMSVGSNQEN